MSGKATFWAWEQKVSGYTKLVLLSIADNANDFGGWSMSRAYIAEKVGISDRQVAREVAKLKEAGLLNVEYNKGIKGTNYYQLNIKIKGDTQTPPMTDSPKRDDTQSPIPTPLPNTTKKKYAFTGDTIKISIQHYEKFQTNYPHLDLQKELSQLDLELAGKRSWFMALNAKLNYRNREAAKNENRNGTPKNAAEASAALQARIDAREAQRGFNGQVVEEVDGHVRGEVYIAVRDGAE
jgi:biotin operon repressor